ncbi:MAG: hypothetical protein SFZ02_06645 [bacterium]|nr:hypothetical protein [bacterium]
MGLSTQRVMFFTLLMLLVVLATRVPVDTDTWWHLRSGEYTLTTGMIYTDPFSFTKAGETWVNHSWGSQIVLYGVWELAGNAGLALYTTFLAVVGMMALYPICAGNVYVRAFVVLIGAITAAVFWSARPQMFSFALSSIFLLILFQYKRDGKDRLWLIPPLMLVWGNLHAGFSIGFIFLIGFIGGELLGHIFAKDKTGIIPMRGIGKLVIITGLSVVALVINPYGFAMLRVPFDTVSLGILRGYIQEWQSPDFQQRQTWAFLGMVFLLMGMAGMAKRGWDWTEYGLVCGTAFLAFMYGRNISTFAVVAVPTLSYHVDAFLTQKGWQITPRTRVSKTQSRLNGVLLGVLIFGGVISVLSVIIPETIEETQRENLPIAVAEFIQQTPPQGRMFNSYNWGGYFVFALPTIPVYVDGRTDLYGDTFLMRYLRTALGQGDWRGVLAEDAIDWVVVEAGSGLANNLADEAGWTKIYPTDEFPDEKAVIFVRNPEE